MTSDPQTAEAFEIPGRTDGAALRFAPGPGDALTMSVAGPGAGTHASVTLDPAWLLPLAAWFAGEAEQVCLGEDPPPPMLLIVSDEAAAVWSGGAWARLRCETPFGPVEVCTGPLADAVFSTTLRLSSSARQDAALRLRHVAAV